MHEASLAQGLLNIVLETVDEHNRRCPDQPAGRVTRLTLGLGQLSCVEPVTFTGCFELLAEGTPAEGAELVIERRPLPCTCTACGAAFDLADRTFVCPRCGGRELEFKGGHGLDLLGLEVEEAPAGRGREETPSQADHRPHPSTDTP